MQPAELFRNIRDSQKRLSLSELNFWLNFLPKTDGLEPEEAKLFYIQTAEEILAQQFKKQNNPESKIIADKMNEDDALRYEVLGRAFTIQQNMWELNAFIEKHSLEEKESKKILEKLQNKTVHEILSAKFNINIAMVDTESLDQSSGISMENLPQYDFVRPKDFFRYQRN